jgi:hypothetical protein
MPPLLALLDPTLARSKVAYMLSAECEVLTPFVVVMAELDPAVRAPTAVRIRVRKGMDYRDKLGDDDYGRKRDGYKSRSATTMFAGRGVLLR